MLLNPSSALAQDKSFPLAESYEKKLLKILKPHQLSRQWVDRLSYGRDCNTKTMLLVKEGKIPFPPTWIVWPETSAQVAALTRMAQDLEIPMIPFGGGSGVCGGTWALKGGIALDLKRMDRIINIETKTMQARVQSGINGEIFERALTQRGLTLGHFPSSIYVATLGGYLACRSAGQFSSRYGKIEDMVEGLEVVLASGEIVQIENVRNRPKEMDLKEVFLGSEGTLGVITEGTFRLHPKPETADYHGFTFPNLKRGLRALREVMQSGLRPTVLRLYDPLDTKLSKSHSNQNSEGEDSPGNFSAWAKQNLLKWVLGSPKWAQSMAEVWTKECRLIIGFEGPTLLVSKQMKRAKQLCLDLRGKDLGKGPGYHWLHHRYSVSYKLSPLFDEGFFADTMEVATTWSNLEKLYQSVREALGKRALVLAHFSHAYPEGCSIYFTFVGYQRSVDLTQTRYDQLWKDALSACVHAGGTISHHHGVGALKSAFMRQEWGDAFEWLVKLKRELDPKNILNPGKLGFPLEWE